VRRETESYQKGQRVRNDSVKTIHPLMILLDTSFLLMMLEQRRDIDEELRDLTNASHDSP